MGDYFKPWRRKIGVVTLVLACVFAAGWVRSLTRVDLIELNGKPWRYNVSSGFGQLHFWQMSPLEKKIPFFRASFVMKLKNFTGHTITNGVATFDPMRNQTTWRWDWMGFHLSDGMKGTVQVRLCFVPYWSIVIPLTLISLWLLLVKPHRSTQKKITEPITEKVV